MFSKISGKISEYQKFLAIFMSPITTRSLTITNDFIAGSTNAIKIQLYNKK